MAAIFNGPIKYYDYPMYGPYKPVDYPTNGGGVMPTKFARTYSSNGILMAPLPSSDLYMVADDLSGGNWASRSGGFTAAKVGNPVYNKETPFDPNGIFTGSGRKSVSDFASGPESSYRFPYNAAHEIRSTQSVTYMGILKVGSGTVTETIMSLFLASNYNFLLEFTYTPGTYYLRCYIGHSVTSCDASATVAPYSYLPFMVTYDASIQRLDVRTSKSSGSSTGSGVPTSAFGADLAIGYNTASGSNPLGTGHIIEILRFQELLNSNDFDDYWTNWFGLTADIGVGGKKCVSYNRPSSAIVEVNKKYWLMEERIPRINENGLRQEKAAFQYMYNSMLNYGSFNAWSQFAFGGSTVTANTTDPDIDVGLNTKCCDISSDGVSSLAIFYQVSSFFVGASEKLMFSISWKASVVGARLYYVIYNSATGRYYDPITKTWGFNPQAYFQASDTNKNYYHVEFTFEATSGTCEIDLYNGSDIVNANNHIYVYSVNLIRTESVRFPVYSPDNTAGICNQDVGAMYAVSGNVDFSNGKIKMGIRPANSSVNTYPTNSALFGSNINVLSTPSGTDDFVATNGVSTSTLSDPYAENEFLELQVDYNNPGFLTLYNLTKGTSSTTGMTADLDAGTNFRVGGSLGTGDSSFGYIKYIIIK